MSKKFTSLIGRMDPASALAGEQRLPEEIKLVAGGDHIEIGPVTITDSAISATEFSGTISSIENHSTDALLEGTTNLYFTDARARAAHTLTTGTALDLVNDSDPLATLSYNSITGAWVIQSASREDVRSSISMDTTVGDITLGQPSDDLVSISYDASTGKISYSSVDMSDIWGALSHSSPGSVDLSTGNDDRIASVTYSASSGVINHTAATVGEIRGLVSATVADQTGSSAAAPSLSYSALGVMTLSRGNALWHKDQVLSDLSANGDIALNANSDDLASLARDPSGGGLIFKSADVSDVKGLFSAPGEDGLDYADGEFSLAQSIKTDADVQFKDLLLSGNLTVQGTTTTVDSTQVAISDTIFVVAKDNATDVAAHAGLRVERGADDAGLIWTKDVQHADGGYWQLVKITDPEDIGGATDMLELRAEKIIAPNLEGDLLGNVTGTVSDISNHSTSDLAEGSNLYFTDARVHAAVSASKGVVEVDGAFEAAIDSSSQLAITKANGLNIAFSVDDSMDPSAIPHHGSLSYAGNQLTFVPVKVEEIRGDFSAKSAEAVTYVEASGLFGLQLHGSSLAQSADGLKLNASITAASGVPSLTVDNATGVFTYTAPSDANIQGRFGVAEGDLDAAPVEASRVATLSYADGTYTLKAAKVSQIFDLISLAADSALTTAPSADGDLMGSSEYDGDGGHSFKWATVAQVRGLSSGSDAVLSNLDGSANSVAPVGTYAYTAATGAHAAEFATVAQIRGLFAASGDLDYNAATGVFSFDPSVSTMAHLAFDEDPADPNDPQPIIELTEQDGAFAPKSMNQFDIRKMFSSDSAGLVYDEASGVLRLELDDMTEERVIAADGIVARYTRGVANEAIASGHLVRVDANGQFSPAKPERDQWVLAGICPPGDSIAQNGSVEGMLAAPVAGMPMMLKCDGTVTQGSMVYISGDPAKAGCVSATMPDQEGQAVVLVGTALENGPFPENHQDQNGNSTGFDGMVPVMLMPQFLFNC